jgi:hypothetical protein
VTPERTALKEWAVLVDGMVRGDFCTMIRKGGIREQRAGFSVRHDQFLLYPTFFHENIDDLSPGVRDSLPAVAIKRPPEGKLIFSHLARVRSHWHVTNLDVLRNIEGEHGLSWAAVQSRFNYRNNPGVHVIAVEILSLPAPVQMDEVKRYLGCVSWVELDATVDISGAVPVHHPEATEECVARLREALGAPAPAEMIDAR